MRTPPPPKTAGTAGRRLWRAVLGEYSLSGADLVMLAHAVELEDELDKLGPMRALGPVIKDAEGRPAVNPATREARLATDALGKALATIRVIGDESAADTRPRLQHRAGSRGVYLRAVD